MKCPVSCLVQTGFKTLYNVLTNPHRGQSGRILSLSSHSRKSEVHPRTDHEDLQGSRGVALLFP